jgi:hypothetical protein
MNLISACVRGSGLIERLVEIFTATVQLQTVNGSSDSPQLQWNALCTCMRALRELSFGRDTVSLMLSGRLLICRLQ